MTYCNLWMSICCQLGLFMCHWWHSCSGQGPTRGCSSSLGKKRLANYERIHNLWFWHEIHTFLSNGKETPLILGYWRMHLYEGIHWSFKKVRRMCFGVHNIDLVTIFITNNYDWMIIGKYYLREASFMLKPQVITSYHEVQYHLKEDSWRGSQNDHELFNNCHSSLRNVIERTFDVLKERFPIIVSGIEPHCSLDTDK